MKTETAHSGRDFADLGDDNAIAASIANASPAPALKAMESAPAGARPFTFVAVGDLELKEPEFLIDGLIETDTLGLVFGDPGCGKTFVAVDLAMCVATGEDFHGHPVKQGPVFYIAGEGHSGLARRFAAWAGHHDIELTDLPLFKSATAAQFLDAGSAAAVVEAVDALVISHGPPVLIEVDTLARNYGPGDENSTEDMGLFIAAMDELRSRWPGAVILIVHHSGHADKTRARGAMALKGALDFEYRVSKDGDRIHLANTKMKDAEPPANLHFTLRTLELGEGFSSAVLIPADTDDSEDAPAKLGKNAKLARDAYIAAAAAHGVFGDDGLQGVSDKHWRSAFYEAVPTMKPGSQATAFKRSLVDLQETGLIVAHGSLYLALDPADLMAINLNRGKADKTDTTRQI